MEKKHPKPTFLATPMVITETSVPVDRNLKIHATTRPARALHIWPIVDLWRWRMSFIDMLDFAETIRGAQQWRAGTSRRGMNTRTKRRVGPVEI